MTQEGTNNVSVTELEPIMETFPQRKTSEPHKWFPSECCRILKEIMPISHQLFQRMSTLPNSFYKTNILLITKPDKQIIKENYRPISLMNPDAKVLNKILANNVKSWSISLIQDSLVSKDAHGILNLELG